MRGLSFVIFIGIARFEKKNFFDNGRQNEMPVFYLYKHKTLGPIPTSTVLAS